MVTRRPRETNRVRSEPRPGWWGTVAPQKSASRPSAVSDPPPHPLHQHSDLFGWHEVFSGKPGTPGGPGLVVRSPPRSAPSRTRSGGPARGGPKPASRFEKSRSRTHLYSIAPAEPRPSLPATRVAGLRGGSAALRSGAAGRAALVREGGEGEGSQSEGGTSGGGARRCSGTLSAASRGSRRPPPNCPLQGRQV